MQKSAQPQSIVIIAWKKSAGSILSDTQNQYEWIASEEHWQYDKPCKDKGTGKQ